MRVLVAGVLKPEKYGQALQAIENFELLHDVTTYVSAHDSWNNFAGGWWPLHTTGWIPISPDKGQWGHRAQDFAIGEAFEMEPGYIIAFPSTPAIILKEAKKRKIPILDLRKMLK